MERLGRYMVVGGSSWFELSGSSQRILTMEFWNVYCWSDLKLEDGCLSSRRFPSFYIRAATVTVRGHRR